MYHFKHVCRKSISVALLVCAVIYVCPVAYSEDSTHAPNSTEVKPIAVTPKNYQAYVDTTNCIATSEAKWLVVAGMGGGKPNQVCPSDHPVMFGYNQLMAYTTAAPWTGAVMGAGGKTQSVCCAIAYKWV